MGGAEEVGNDGSGEQREASRYCFVFVVISPDGNNQFHFDHYQASEHDRVPVEEP